MKQKQAHASDCIATLENTAKQEKKDNDNDNDILKKSPTNSRLEAWPCRRERRGHDPATRSLFKAGVACAVGKVGTCTQLNDSVQYIGSR